MEIIVNFKLMFNRINAVQSQEILSSEHLTFPNVLCLNTVKSQHLISEPEGRDRQR